MVSGSLPQCDDDPRYRYFGPHGSVEDLGAGRFALYIGGSLIGTYSESDPAERDILIVIALREPRVKARAVALAFRVSEETVRRARVREQKGGLMGVTRRGRRGAPLKRTAKLRRKAFGFFDQGYGVARTHTALAASISVETVRVLYHEWLADRASRANRTAPREQSADALAATATEKVADACSVGSVAAQAIEPAPTDQPTVVEAASDGPAEDGASDKPTVAEVAADRSRAELAIKEVVGSERREMVQHVGSWIMLAMLQWLGAYGIAKEACDKSASAVALRIALDAVAIALSIGQRCVEGIRRLATPTAGILLRSKGAISPGWARRVLGRFAQTGSELLQLGLAARLIGRNTQAEVVWLYVDNHMRPYTGRQVIRKGWRMQDKRARPGASDYYVHDEEGRPLFRVDTTGHGSLTDWLLPIGKFVRDVLGRDRDVCLCFDRGGAFPEHMAALRDSEVGFLTYERAPYPCLPVSSFDKEVVVVRRSRPKEPVLVRYTEQRKKNLGKGRGRVRRISMLMPDGVQINLLSANCSAPIEELVVRQLGRWGFQENQLKHEVERWGINQLDGRTADPYPADATIPNPARRRLDLDLRMARAHEGALRSKLVRLAEADPKRQRLLVDLEEVLALQRELEATRPTLPTHAAVKDTELADKLVQHRREYKRVIDALRGGLANAESELACRLAPNLKRPREAKKALANLLASPGSVVLDRKVLRVELAPAGTAAELTAFQALLQELTELGLVLPGDPGGHRLAFRIHT